MTVSSEPALGAAVLLYAALRAHALDTGAEDARAFLAMAEEMCPGLAQAAVDFEDQILELQRQLHAGNPR